MINLTSKQISDYKSKSSLETDREIYKIVVGFREIRINGDWSIERRSNRIDKAVVSAIEAYCTRDNIEWEYNSTYSAWCD
jgi:hypothetical protein